jgi:hypothetical protein
MQKIPRRLREQLMPIYSSLYPSLKDSFSFGKPYSSIDSFTVAKNQFKYFSTKEKAQEYITLNKPCLSLKEVWDAYSSADNPYTATKELAKQKTNQ